MIKGSRGERGERGRVEGQESCPAKILSCPQGCINSKSRHAERRKKVEGQAMRKGNRPHRGWKAQSTGFQPKEKPPDKEGCVKRGRRDHKPRISAAQAGLCPSLARATVVSELLGQHAARGPSSPTPFRLSQPFSLFFSFATAFFPSSLSPQSLSGWEPNWDHPAGGVTLSRQMSLWKPLSHL